MRINVVNAVSFVALFGVAGCGTETDKDIRFAKEAMESLLRGDSKSMEVIDWESLEYDDESISDQYNRILDDQEKENFCRRFVHGFSTDQIKCGKDADTLFSSLRNWRVAERNSSRAVVTYQTPKSNTGSITIVRKEGKRVITVLNTDCVAEKEVARERVALERAKVDTERARIEAERLKAQVEKDRIALEREKLSADSKSKEAQRLAMLEKERPKREAEAAAKRERDRIIKEKIDKITALKEERATFEMTFPFPGQNGKKIDQLINEVQGAIEATPTDDGKAPYQVALKNLQQQALTLKGQGIPMAHRWMGEVEAKIAEVNQANINPTEPNGATRNGRLTFVSIVAKNAAKTALQKDLENLKKYKSVLEAFDIDIAEAAK